MGGLLAIANHSILKQRRKAEAKGSSRTIAAGIRQKFVTIAIVIVATLAAPCLHLGIPDSVVMSRRQATQDPEPSRQLAQKSPAASAAGLNPSLTRRDVSAGF